MGLHVIVLVAGQLAGHGSAELLFNVRLGQVEPSAGVDRLRRNMRLRHRRRHGTEFAAARAQPCFGRRHWPTMAVSRMQLLVTMNTQLSSITL